MLALELAPPNNALRRIVKCAYIRYNDKLCRKSDSWRALIRLAYQVCSSLRFAMTIQTVLSLMSTIMIAIKLFMPVKV